MDPATLTAILSLSRFAVQTAEQYASGALTTDQVNQLLAAAGINVDQAIAAWKAAGGAPAPVSMETTTIAGADQGGPSATSQQSP